MASGDDSSDIAAEWSVEVLDLVPIEEVHSSFGRYVLCYEIASGGMGTVYLAREQGPGGFTRPVAIKRIHPHLARKKQFVEMFLDEARVAARIIHPNVCSVYGFGEVGGTHYIAMEYLVGQPLSEVAPRIARQTELATSPRWYALAARIVADACEGLHAAHELRDESGELLNVVHRDVSTHNIFVTYDGAVRVLDFGIARARGRKHETRTGAVKGKFAYMSPEQARASKTIDRRSDVWSLGVVLWELLALRRLFGRRSEVELLRAVGEEPIVPPSLVRPEVPPQLDAIVMRALDRDIENRYPTARALARDLGAYVSKSGEGTSLADLAELLGDFFAEERAGKLGAVAAVMHTNTADRIVSDVQPPPPPTRGRPTPPRRIVKIDDAQTHLLPSPAEASDQSPTASAPIAHESEVRTGSSVVLMSAPPSRRSMAIWITLGAGALAIAVAAGVGIALGTSSEAAPTASAPPRTQRERVTADMPSAPAKTPAPRIVAAPPERASAPDRVPERSADPETTPIVRAPTAEEGAVAAQQPTEANAAAPAAQSAPRPQMGRVNVVATGAWAEIYVRGRFVARTPHALRLPAGRQVIELRPNGTGEPRRVTVDVRPGAETRVVVPLSPAQR